MRYIVTAQHGGLAQQVLQQLPSVGIAADHSRQLRVKALEGRKLQKKPPYRQIKALVNMFLKIYKYLTPRLHRDFRTERLSAGHTLCGSHNAKWVTDGFLQNGANCAVCHGNFIGIQEFSDIVTVKEQIVCPQYTHQPRVLKRRQAAGRRTPGEQHITALRAGANPFAKRLLLGFLLHKLKIVNQQNVPILR